MPCRCRPPGTCREQTAATLPAADLRCALPNMVLSPLRPRTCLPTTAAPGAQLCFAPGCELCATPPCKAASGASPELVLLPAAPSTEQGSAGQEQQHPCHPGSCVVAARGLDVNPQGLGWHKESMPRWSGECCSWLQTVNGSCPRFCSLWHSGAQPGPDGLHSQQIALSSGL